eukprot:8584409-Heterocapsa_arctica.AAC.1
MIGVDKSPTIKTLVRRCPNELCPNKVRFSPKHLVNNKAILGFGKSYTIKAQVDACFSQTRLAPRGLPEVPREVPREDPRGPPEVPSDPQRSPE